MTSDMIRKRWQMEVGELEELETRTGGKFRFRQTPIGLQIVLTCRSPVARGSDVGDPAFEDCQHVVDLLRPPHWPAQSPILIHRLPKGVLHPNIYYPAGSEPGLQPGLPRGWTCYTDRPSPQQRLAIIVEQVYDMLGYRFGKYSRSLADCLNPNAVRWVNRVLAENPEWLPTERRPFIEN